MKKTNHFYRFCALALSCLLLVSLFPVMQAFADGDGAIHIKSAEDLRSLAHSCTLDSWSRGKTVVLDNDIVLESDDALPIPTFGGTFRGNGHTISGLSITQSVSPAGLFGVLQKDAVIKNLNVEGTVTPSGDSENIGGIVGENHGTIESCTFNGSVSGKRSVGGIAGRNLATGIVRACEASGAIFGQSMTGGIVGENLGSIVSCRGRAYVNIESTDPSIDLSDLSLDFSLDLASLSRLDTLNIATDTGGIAGRSSGMILTSVNTGTIGYEHIGYNVGGIVGRTDGLVSGCVNQGRVLGRKDVGGIAGQADSATIEACANYATVTGTSRNVGGIVGASCDQTKTFTNCQFDGIIVGAATYRRTAGILGRSNANTNFTNCVVSGIALGMDNSSNLNASRLGGTGSVPTVNNVYTSVKMVDCWAANNTPIQIAADTDLSALLAQKDADGNAIWVKAEGSLYPILAIAKNHLNDGNKHLSVALSGADLSWFNPSDTGRTKTVTNERELWALEKLLTAAGAKQSAFLTLQKINVRNVLIPMLDDLSSDMKTALLAKTVAKTDAAQVVNVYAQTSKAVTEGSNCYAVRFVAEINGNQWAGAGFDLLVSYTTADGVKMTSKLTEQTVSVCYKSISAGDDSVTAPDGHYFIVFVLDQVPVSNGNMTFTVAAYANGADGAVYGNAGVVTFDANGSVVAD